MKPIIKVLNSELELVGLVDDYISLYFNNIFSDIGECKIEISNSSENAPLLCKGAFLYLNTFECWIIEEINIENNQLSITALPLAFILKHRITEPLQGQTHLNYSKKLTGYIMKDLIEKCLVKATDNKRNINMITSTSNIGHKIDFQSRYRNLFDEIQKLSNYSAIGFRIGINIKERKFILDIYQGQDLSEEVYFSEEFDNITDIKITDSNLSYKNFIYVAGKGQGLERNIIKVDEGNYSGFNRREEMKDARDKETTDELYVEADTILAENTIKTSFEGILIPDGTYKFEEDFKLGDIVTIISKKYGYSYTQRITEYSKEYTTENGEVIEIIIGNPKPTLSFDKEEVIE